MPTRIHLRIRGKVQGVGFRWFVREQARRCDLAGWVRNNPDGSVELAARGEMAGKRIVVIAPDGGERYMSLPFFVAD